MMPSTHEGMLTSDSLARSCRAHSRWTCVRDERLLILAECVGLCGSMFEKCMGAR
jgi:hypothetical protein